MTITQEDLVAGFKELGVEVGDVLLVHSSYLYLGSVKGGVEGGPGVVVDALLNVLTDEGTLIVPTFNFGFTRGEPWDIRNTPSHMGTITEIVRKDLRSCRVMHPIHSFAIIGKLAKELCGQRYKGSFARDSILGRLRDLDGKIMIIGLRYNQSLTFMHHVEEMIGVQHRFHKEFTGLVTDEEGNTYEDTFTMYVRDIDNGVNTDYEPLGKALEEAGVVNIRKIGNGLVKLMRANDIYPVMERELKAHPGPGFVYWYEKKDE